MAGKKRSFVRKLKSKYRLVIQRDTTYEEVWFMRLSRLNVLTVISSSVLLLAAIIVLLIIYTPVKELIPGYPSGEMTRNIRLNALKLDSLEYELQIKDQFIDNLTTIIRGDEPRDYDMSDSEIPVSTTTIEDYHSKEDSILREEVEEQQRFSLSLFEPANNAQNLSEIFFFPPVKGMVSSHFDADKKHFGVDLVPTDDQLVKATLDGTIMMADYTAETGYLIQVLHSNEIISVYKHNKQLLKKTGDVVRTGEAIAIAGDTGELSSGPHLHFELWYKGKPINPVEYIVFN